MNEGQIIVWAVGTILAVPSWGHFAGPVGLAAQITGLIILGVVIFAF